MSGLNLEKTIEKARRELKRIQRSPEKTKRRYLVVLSSLAMVVVVGLWFSYLNFTLPQPPSGDVGEIGGGNTMAVRGEDADSFFKTLGQGAKNIFEGLKNQFMNFKEDLSRVKEFTLEGGGADFAPGEGPLEPTPLP